MSVTLRRKHRCGFFKLAPLLRTSQTGSAHERQQTTFSRFKETETKSISHSVEQCPLMSCISFLSCSATRELKTKSLLNISKWDECVFAHFMQMFAEHSEQQHSAQSMFGFWWCPKSHSNNDLYMLQLQPIQNMLVQRYIFFHILYKIESFKHLMYRCYILQVHNLLKQLFMRLQSDNMRKICLITVKAIVNYIN